MAWLSPPDRYRIDPYGLFGDGACMAAADNGFFDSGATEEEFSRAVEAFFPDGHDVQMLEDAPHLVKVTSGAEAFIVRRWPEDASAERIAFVAEALASAAEASLTPKPVHSPNGEASVLIDGRRYSAEQLLPGSPAARYGGYRTPDGSRIDVPLPSSTPVESLVEQTAAALGRVHMATRPLASGPDRPTATLSSFLADTRRSWSANRARLGQHAEGSVEIRRWLRCGNRVIPAASDMLNAAGTTLHERSVATHGDIWPVHLLVDGDNRLTGITGWSGAAMGSPVLDLTMLAVHTSGWSADIAETVLGAYSDAAPLTPEQRRILPVVAGLHLMTHVAYMIDLAFLDDRLIDHLAMPVLRSGLRSMLTSLEALTVVLVPEEPRSSTGRHAGSVRRSVRTADERRSGRGGRRGPRGDRRKPS